MQEVRSKKGVITTHCQPDDAGRLHGVVHREDDAAVVQPSLEV